MYLGIEIGGTKLQLGLGAGDGVIDALWRGTVVPEDGADGIRRQIEAAIPELLAGAKRKREELKGVGIGFGGPVDDVTRSVIKSHQIAGWDGFPLADWIADIVGVPAVLGNDADVAGLAEAHFGAGKGLSPIFYITIGSGIGGGLIINGEIYRGCGRGAAEIGHLDAGGIPWSNLVEDCASGWAIADSARRHLEEWAYEHTKNSILWKYCEYDPKKLTAKDVARGAVVGDHTSKWILDNVICAAQRRYRSNDFTTLPAPHRHRRRRIADGRGGAVRTAAKTRGRARLQAVRGLLRHRAGGARRRGGHSRGAGVGEKKSRARSKRFERLVRPLTSCEALSITSSAQCSLALH